MLIIKVHDFLRQVLQEPECFRDRLQQYVLQPLSKNADGEVCVPACPVQLSWR